MKQRVVSKWFAWMITVCALVIGWTVASAQTAERPPSWPKEMVTLIDKRVRFGEPNTYIFHVNGTCVFVVDVVKGATSQIVKCPWEK